MDAIEKQEKHLHKAKNWNLVLLIITAISAALSLTSIPTVLNPQEPDLDALGLTGELAAYSQEVYEFSTTLLSKAYSIIEILVTIAIVVLLFLNHRRIKENILPMKSPYYLTFLMAVASVVYTVAFMPSLQVDGLSSSIVVASSVIFVSLFTVVPAIIALVHTFKADVEG